MARIEEPLTYMRRITFSFTSESGLFVQPEILEEKNYRQVARAMRRAAQKYKVPIVANLHGNDWIAYPGNTGDTIDEMMERWKKIQAK